jgi:hypothetical protein
LYPPLQRWSVKHDEQEFLQDAASQRQSQFGSSKQAFNQRLTGQKSRPRRKPFFLNLTKQR